MGGLASGPGPVTNGYMVPPSLLKPNTNGYNVNFLNNGTPDKDLGKCAVRYKLRKMIPAPPTGSWTESILFYGTSRNNGDIMRTAVIITQFNPN